MKYPQKSDGKSDHLWYSYGYQKCMFFDFPTEYVGLPIVFIIEYVVN